MRRFHLFAILLLIPALTFVVSCGSGSKDGGKVPDKADSGTKTAPSGPKTELASTGWGSLKGKITLEGEVPPVGDLKDQMKDAKNPMDREHCLMGDVTDQKWKVDPSTKGVANVVVWLQPPSGKYFKIKDEDKKRTDVVTVDQPFCSFIPHVSVVYPSYYDGKKQAPSGQQFKIQNSAPLSHNSRIGGTISNPAVNKTISAAPPGGKPNEEKIDLSPDRQAITLNCDFHKWMTGYIWAFDHPYAAVSKGDDKKDAADFGVFEIANVPTGADVDIMYWHESFDKPKKLKTVKLKDGANEENIPLKR